MSLIQLILNLIRGGALRSDTTNPNSITTAILKIDKLYVNMIYFLRIYLLARLEHDTGIYEMKEINPYYISQGKSYGVSLKDLSTPNLKHKLLKISHSLSDLQLYIIRKVIKRQN